MPYPYPPPYYLPTYLPGPYADLGPATFIAQDLVRVNFPSRVAITAAYLDPASYVISLRSGSPVSGTGVTVLRVLAPTRDVVIADYAYLETTRHSMGAWYNLDVDELLVDTGGTSLSLPTIAYAARVTKTMATLKSMPAHFDSRPEALIRNLLTALSLEDDRIGGSRSDEFA